jgi:GNAT superfamily N-acetyltransferase
MMMFSRRTFQIIKQRFLYDFLLETVGRKVMSRSGFVARPYYIFKEGLFDSIPKEFRTMPKGYEISFLTHDDVQSLDLIEGRFVTAGIMQEKLSKGHKCLGLWIEGKIAAFTWCQFDMLDFPRTKGYALLKNEAYLYDMYVLRDYRGLKIAPFLRYKCYQELAKLGRTVLFSVSDFSNKPALRFKKKLDAKIISLNLYIRIGKNLRWNVKLKTYSKRMRRVA